MRVYVGYLIPNTSSGLGRCMRSPCTGAPGAGQSGLCGGGVVSELLTASRAGSSTGPGLVWEHGCVSFFPNLVGHLTKLLFAKLLVSVDEAEGIIKWSPLPPKFSGAPRSPSIRFLTPYS